MNHSAKEMLLDGRTQNSIYSKNNFQNEEDNDAYMHQIPQQSFEGVHGVNEDYEEEQDFEQQEEFEEGEYEEGYQEDDQEGEYYQEGEEIEGNPDDEEYPKVKNI